MPIVIDIGSWQFWTIALIVFLFVLWVLRRNRTETPPISRSVSPQSYSPAFIATPIGTPIPVDEVDSTPELAISIDQPTPVYVNTAPDPLKVVESRKFRSIGERLTCTALEEILERTVQVNIRPSYLINPETNRRMEYDCFDPVLNLAVEYQGEGHYKSIFGQSQDKVDSQQRRDKAKKVCSIENGVTLIEVPYYEDVCDPDPYNPGAYKYNHRLTEAQRYERIKVYLKDAIEKSNSIGACFQE